MLKKEILDILKSRRAQVIFILFSLLMLYDFAGGLYDGYHGYWSIPDAPPEYLGHPTTHGFLNNGHASSKGQVLLYWLLPIWCLLLCSDSFIHEKKCGYVPLVDSRISRKQFFWKKNQAAFLCGFACMATCLSINLVLCTVVFSPGTYLGGLEDYIGLSTSTAWFNFSLTHRYLVYWLYIGINGVVMGLLCCMGTSLSMALPSYPLVYGICFMIWYPQISNSYGVLNVTQPYLNLKAPYFIIGFVVFLIPVILSMIAGYFIRVKRDVL